MDKKLQLARRRSGIASFERKCRLTKENSRLKKAYRVPGTKEAGRWYMLNSYTNLLLQKLQDS